MPKIKKTKSKKNFHLPRPYDPVFNGKNMYTATCKYSCNIRITTSNCLTCCFTKGTLQNHKWENAMTVDKHSWGYRRNVDVTSYLTITELLNELASTVRLLSTSDFLITFVY